MTKIKLLVYKIIVNFVSDVYGMLKIPHPKQRFRDINECRKLIHGELETEYSEESFMEEQKQQE